MNARKMFKRNLICRTQPEHTEEFKKSTQGQMLKPNIIQKQTAWARSLLTVSILITETADVSNECKPLWLGYNS